jgi:hypothetical protein
MYMRRGGDSIRIFDDGNSGDSLDGCVVDSDGLKAVTLLFK